MYHILIRKFVLICFVASAFSSCNKTKFLEAKSSSNLVVPSTLQDFQQLLDNQKVMTESGGFGTLTSDEYFLQDDFWATLPVKEQNAYTWSPDIYGGEGNVVDWNKPYEQVFYANVVLDGLQKMQPVLANQEEYDRIKGSAYFIRAYAFFNLAQVFAPVYDSTTASTDPGIPLKLNPDINKTEPRSSVLNTYNQILGDLSEANMLLSPQLPVDNRNRPSKAASYALMARIFLSVGNYELAGLYADSSLQVYSALIDYNTGTIFSDRNDETLYQSNQQASSVAMGYITFGNNSLIDSGLYALYENDDLRKTKFFRANGHGYYNLKNTYDGYGACFTGLATDECFLIRAESSARAGNLIAALNDLNTMLEKRYVTGTFIPRSATTIQDAIDRILIERRKELFLRGVRFTDLRRLNKAGYHITLTRKLNGQTYALEPNSVFYTLPIPPDEIAQSGITQNLR